MFFTVFWIRQIPVAQHPQCFINSINCGRLPIPVLCSSVSLPAISFITHSLIVITHEIRVFRADGCITALYTLISVASVKAINSFVRFCIPPALPACVNDSVVWSANALMDSIIAFIFVRTVLIIKFDNGDGSFISAIFGYCPQRSLNSSSLPLYSVTSSLGSVSRQIAFKYRDAPFISD